MLVLSRKAGEKLQIGRDVTFTVLGIKANRVRLGIEAPRQISVMRAEMQTFEAVTAGSRPAPEAKRLACG
jgi:carbon storage regulator